MAESGPTCAHIYACRNNPALYYIVNIIYNHYYIDITLAIYIHIPLVYNFIQANSTASLSFELLVTSIITTYNAITDAYTINTQSICSASNETDSMK